jgi:hypothetical protein
MKMKDKLSTQITGNIGLYYICYELSKKGWNVLPTSRNSKGIDILIYSETGEGKFTIQVKTLTKQNAIPLGKNINNFMADYFIICLLHESENAKNHELFVITKKDLESFVSCDSDGSCWACNNKTEWENFREKYKNLRILANGRY